MSVDNALLSKRCRHDLLSSRKMRYTERWPALANRACPRTKCRAGARGCKGWRKLELALSQNILDIIFGFCFLIIGCSDLFLGS